MIASDWGAARQLGKAAARPEPPVKSPQTPTTSPVRLASPAQDSLKMRTRRSLYADAMPVLPPSDRPCSGTSPGRCATCARRLASRCIHRVARAGVR